jgi:hypothetical protein
MAGHLAPYGCGCRVVGKVTFEHAWPAVGEVACEFGEVAPKKKKGMCCKQGQEPGSAQKMCQPTLKGGQRSALNNLIAIIGA